ncbi:MAG: T9SS type A sorting domain-containing protein [Flavobacteriales bacterium]|nr:T9SS type A sorting domain-containing protein [Flavobacteriales bacterium]
MNGGVMSMNLLPDGRIIIAGEFTEYDNEPRNGIARLNSDGTLDEGFDPGSGASSEIVSSVAVGDGVVIGVYFTSFDGVGRNRIARLRNSVVGVNDLEGNSNPLLFPNPSAGRFILRSTEHGGELAVRVHDMLGQEVAVYQYRGGELVMELGHLPSASYVVQWIGNNRNGCIPIIVAH